ncbi:MAG: hypothetical protein L0H84_03580 [Pseudonocardia sp.]|nr:hypothetical protein [Pseudonocardia sp.]
MVLAANTAIDERRVKALPRPMSLTRDAKPPAVGRWVDQLERAVRAHTVSGPVAAVIVHRDADAPDPAGAAHHQLARQLMSINGLPVVPVQAIEAWWFLFPEAVESVRPSAWRGRLPRRPQNVELINNPKAELCRLTRTPRASAYAEADAATIAAHVRRKGLAPLHTCPSYDRLTTMAKAIR